jgi:hypothetical protein
MLHTINKVLNKVVKKGKTLKPSTLIIGFIVLAICIIFIVSNSLEYNLYGNKKHLDSFDDITNDITSYNIKFDKNDDITKRNITIYYNEFERDLVLKEIKFTLDDTTDINYLKTKSNINTVYIQDSKLNKYNITSFDITQVNKIITINTYDKPFNLPVDPQLGDENLFSLIITYRNDNEIIFPFKVGEKRFRYNGEILSDPSDSSNKLDIITIYNYIENSKTVNETLPDNNDDITMQQFNKVIFKIEKPDLQEIKKEFTSRYINAEKYDFTEQIKQFDKYTPSKFIIKIIKTSNNNKSVDIQPKYSVPNEGALCLDGNEKFLLINDVACKLTLSNIIPEEDYELSIIIEYRDINDMDNTRYSDKYSLKFTAQDNGTGDNSYDLLTPTIQGIKAYDFTNQMIKLLNLQSKFNKEQKNQDNELRKLETDLETSLANRNI